MRALVFALILCLPTIVLADRVKVVVQPFSNDDQDAVARAVQASIIADLSRAEGLAAEAGPVEADSQKAIDLAKTRGARFLVVGAYHIVDSDTRFTGQVVDLSNGNVIGGIKATGPMRDLFGLEDQLAIQAQRVMQQTIKPAAPPPPAVAPAVEAPAAPPTSPQPTIPVTTFEGSELDRSLRPQVSARDAFDRGGRNYRYDYGPGYGYGYGYGALYPGYAPLGFYGYFWPDYVVRNRPDRRPVFLQWSPYAWQSW